MYYVYILKLNNGNLYKGSTENLRRRIKEHKSGEVTSTKKYLPAEMIYYEAFFSKTDAIREELFMKTGRGKEVLKERLKHSIEK
jgi:putative endonuclease